MAADITLTHFPTGLVALDQEVLIQWQEPISATMKYGVVHGNYPNTIGVSGIRQLQFTPQNEGITPGVYFCIIATGSFTSIEFPLMIESPQAPRIVSPANHSVVTTSTPNYTWDEVSGVPFYHIIVSDTPVEIFEDELGDMQIHGGNLIWQAITPNTSIVHGSEDPSGFFTTFNNISPPIMENADYNWVVLNNYSGTPAHSSIVQAGVNSFTANLGVGLQVPTAISPTNNAVLSNETITFEWTRAPNASHYQLLLSEKREEQGSDTQYLIWTPTTTNTIIELPAKDLLKRTEYSWRVAVVNAVGNGKLSAPFRFSYNVPRGLLRITTRDQSGNILPRTSIDIIPQNGSTEITTLLTTDSGLLENPVQPGTYEIKAYKDGYADTSAIATVNPNETIPVNLTLRFLRQIIRGRVRDSQSAVVEAATVVAEKTSDATVFTTSSDVEGFFQLEVTEGQWIVYAHKPGYLGSDTLSVAIQSGQSIILSNDLVLTQNGAVLNGKTVNANGVPLVDVTVTARQGIQSSTTVSNSKGNFHFVLTAGTWTIIAQKVGYISPTPRTITLQSGATVSLQPDLRMNGGAAIVSGFVADENRVLIGATVTATPDVGYATTTTTDAKGSYALSLAPGNYQITAKKKGYVKAPSYQIQLSGNQTVSGIDFLLVQGAAVIEGRVTDGSGPISGVIVHCEIASDTTNFDGYYRLVVTHGTYKLNATKRGYTSGGAKTIAVGDGEIKSNINFSMSTNAGTIGGTVRSNAQPVPGADVEANNGTLSFRTTTDFDGTYWFSLPPGIWNFTAGKMGFNGSSFNGVALNAGQQVAGVDISLSLNQASLLGRVKDSQGREVRNATIQVIDSNVTAISDPFGVYALSLPPGNYQLRASKRGYKSQTKTTAITSGSSTSLDFQLPVLGTIWGTITNQQGTPLQNILVLAAAADTSRDVTDYAGSYTIFLDSGTYQLIADHLGYAAYSTSVTISLGQTLQRDISLLSAPSEIATLRGRVLDSEGQPLDGIGVQLGGGTSSLIFTDMNGEFYTGILAAGQNYTLTPVGDGRFFVPSTRTYNPLSLNQTNQNFSSGLYGDVSANEQINSFDGSLVLRIRAEQNVSPYYADLPRDSIAADVSGGSGVSSFDASLIFRYAVGLINSFPAESKILLKSTIDSADVRNVWLEFDKVVGSSVIANVVIDKADDIYAAEIDLGYDSVCLQLEDVQMTELTTGLNTAYSVKGGRVKIAMASINALQGQGDLCRLYFGIMESNSGRPRISDNSAGINDIQLNEGIIPTHISGQPLIFNERAPTRFRLYECYPNPFNMRTTISYDLPESKSNSREHPSSHQVSLRIINTLGQIVRVLFEGSQSSGHYRVLWDGTDDDGLAVASGVYLYELRTGNFQNMKKLLLLE